MGLDIRLPIGMMFALHGAMLFFYGLSTSDAAFYSRSLSLNVNLVWGICLFVFGSLMLFFAFRGRSSKGRGSDDRGGSNG